MITVLIQAHWLEMYFFELENKIMLSTWHFMVQDRHNMKRQADRLTKRLSETVNIKKKEFIETK